MSTTNLSHDTFYLWKKHHLYTSLTPSSSERNENPNQPANQHATSYTDKEKKGTSRFYLHYAIAKQLS